MDLATIVERFNDELRVDAYADLDPSANGLQVGRPTGTVERAAVTVDAATTTIRAAREHDVDLLVAHHGVVFGGLDRVTDRTYDAIAELVAGDIDLYAVHLPLDGHQELGNAAQLGDRLGLVDRTPFGEIGPEYGGQRGRLPEPRALGDIAAELEAALPTGGQSVQTLDFGPETVEEVAIVTGSGTDWIDEAAAVGADVLITGEGKQAAYHEALDREVNVVLAGHYATETGGVQALGELLTDWGVEVTTIEHPTGL